MSASALPFAFSIHSTDVALTFVVKSKLVSLSPAFAALVILLIETNVYSKLTSVDGLATPNLFTTPTAPTGLVLILYFVLSGLDNIPVLGVLIASAWVIVTTVKPYVKVDGCFPKLLAFLAVDVIANVDHPNAFPAGATPVHNATLLVTAS